MAGQPVDPASVIAGCIFALLCFALDGIGRTNKLLREIRDLLKKDCQRRQNAASEDHDS